MTSDTSQDKRDGTQQHPELLKSERARYSRHLLLPEVGEEGQRKLKGARVLLVGAGGLGSPAALYLAAAGVGRIGIIDGDVVDVTNLQRQILYGTEDVGSKKAETAAKALEKLNPEISFVTYTERLTEHNALKLIGEYDIVVDGTDNFGTRYLVNDACYFKSKPNVYGSIFRFEGQASVFCTPLGPCYRCLFPDPPAPDAVPNCAEAGVLGVLAGVIGTIQATEALKLALGLGNSLAGYLLIYDAIGMEFTKLKIRRRDDCPLCGKKPTIKDLKESSILCAALSNSNENQLPEIEPRELAMLLAGKSPPRLLDVRNPEEHQICHLDNSVLIPLGELERRFGELSADEDVVVYCRSGNRSRRAIELLKSKGFSKLTNLNGGISAWAEQVDRSMPRY